MEGLRMSPNLLPVVALISLAAFQTLNAQPATLGRPVPAASLGVPDALVQSTSHNSTARGSNPDPLMGEYATPARLGPISEVRLGPSQSGPALDTPDERYNWGIPEHLAPRSKYTSPSRSSNKFGDKMSEWFDNGGNTWGNFESDHCFDDFISPMSNPFLAEDPRSLTEIRPIFMFQSIPNSQYLYHGGNIEYFAIQGRLALTQRLSLVLHKLGGLVINPGSESALSSASGFAEIWLGPKYTWYRDETTQTIASAGLQFQIATGNSSVYQDTGSLSFVPYVNVGQKFWKTSWGTMAVMDTLGYAIPSSSQRSAYSYNSFHLDYDIANWGRIYPFIELNWFHYTRNGTARNLGFEGFDLANIGSAVAGRDFLSLAVGSRFKFNEKWQCGISAEFPLLGTRDLFGFRLGLDLIWRY
jgi:hypothetical protein